MIEAELATLAWRLVSPRLITATCGEEGQGRICIEADCEGRWSWRLDMLPGSDEPIVTSAQPLRRSTDAMAAVLLQLRSWPALIEGATR